MGLGLGISVDWASLVPYYAQVASAFKARVEADGGTVESMSCLKADLKVLNPIKPPAYTGLLNDYSGAAAAYSLRLLDNTYTGNAIKVRRASDNAEQDIAFSNNELDTATLETFASGTNAFVTTWYDQSGNGNDATQTIAALQPKIVSAGTSLGYIENLTSASEQLLKSSFSYTASSAFSAFMVVQNFGNAVFGGTEQNAEYYGVSQDGELASGSFNNMTSVSYYSNGSSIGLTRDAIDTATNSFAELTTLATPNGTNEMWLGYAASSFNYLRMKEYIVYDNQTISRTGVEDNIITHYGF